MKELSCVNHNRFSRVLRKSCALFKYFMRLGISGCVCMMERDVKYGHSKSIKEGRPVDADGKPLPWYTYPAIDYISQLNFKNKTVFEYGCGQGSLYWAAHCGKIVSVESDEEWYDRIRREKRDNNVLVLSQDREAYINAIFDGNVHYDVVIIDDKYRMECAKAAVKCLAEGGIVILDNSDWYPKTSKYLRNAGLLQVDFTGPGPSNYYTWTTSIFFYRGFVVEPKYAVLPVCGPCSLNTTVNDE